MKNNYIILFLSILFLGLFSSASAQEKKLTKADSKYEHLKYVDAQQTYLAVAEIGFESEELFIKLGNTFYFNAQYDEASKWYGRLFNLTKTPKEDIVFLRYSQALKAIGEHEKAQQYYDTFITKTGADTTPKKALDYLELIENNSGRYQIRAIEGIYDEDKISFGHTKIGNKLVFASTQNTQTFLNRRSSWDGLSFLSLYEVELDENNATQGKPKMLRGELNSKFHESSPVFTADGNTMYFTRSNITQRQRDKDQHLKIYQSIKKDGKWQEAEELNFNSDLYSSAHPALNADETKLYFSSDRPGGFGQSDLYVSVITPDGTIGAPENLGPKINTSGKETFPFVTRDNELYFSSDGHFGLGGMDVFYVKLFDYGFGNLLNVGEPINSYADDFAFGIDENKRGFISSNRTDTTGEFVYDNIYSFVEEMPIIDLYFALIEGYVTDRQSGEPIENATLTFRDPESNLFVSLTTDENGYYTTETNKFEVYTIRAEKEGYDTDEKLSQANLDSQRIDFQLQKNKQELIPGTDLAKVLNIPTIYFDFDKSNIRPDAQVELEKVYAVMMEYPGLRINIRSHTDSRGSDSYNKLLSERRASSTREYLISKGIESYRLTSEGLGETELVNHCSNGVICSVEEHQANRRSEFIVIE